jgi:hypothetical protein
MRALFPIKLSLPSRIAVWALAALLLGGIFGPICCHAYWNDRLFAAADSGDDAQILALIDRGAEVDAQNIYGDTPLMYAARNGRIRTARLLITCGADVNARDKFGVTASRWADNHKYEYRVLSQEEGGKVRADVRSNYRETLALLKSSGARL